MDENLNIYLHIIIDFIFPFLNILVSLNKAIEMNYL